MIKQFELQIKNAEKQIEKLIVAREKARIQLSQQKVRLSHLEGNKAKATKVIVQGIEKSIATYDKMIQYWKQQLNLIKRQKTLAEKIERAKQVKKTADPKVRKSIANSIKKLRQEIGAIEKTKRSYNKKILGLSKEFIMLALSTSKKLAVIYKKPLSIATVIGLLGASIITAYARRRKKNKEEK